LWQMPAQAVVSAMIEEITSGNECSREFMDWMTVRPKFGTGYNRQRVEDLAGEMKRRAGEIMAAVLALSRDESASTRQWALMFAINFCQGNEIDPAEIEGLIARLQEELPSRDVVRIRLVSGVLAKAAPDTEGLVESLTYVLSDEEMLNRSLAMQALEQLGSRAAPAVPKLVSLLTEYLKPPSSDATSHAYINLNTMFGRPSDIRIEIIQTLGKIGPAAKAALPVLRKVVSTHAKELGKHAEKAIAEIEGPPQEDQ